MWRDINQKVRVFSMVDRKKAVRRRDATGHLDTEYERKLRAFTRPITSTRFNSFRLNPVLPNLVPPRRRNSKRGHF